MAKFNMVVLHRLAQSEALRRIQNEIEALKGQHDNKLTGLRDNWDNNMYAFQGSAMGFSASGVMMVKPFQVEIDADLPWLATFIKGRIETVIRERLTVLLA
jgi:hypothetical protein